MHSQGTRNRSCGYRSAALTLSLAALLSLPSAAEAQTPKLGGTLNLATNQTIDTLDSSTSSTTLVRTIHEHTHSQLFVFDGKYSVIPDLALSHTVSSDFKVWTFKLRKGVLFHDGSSLDSGDVVSSWNRYVKV